MAPVVGPSGLPQADAVSRHRDKARAIRMALSFRGVSLRAVLRAMTLGGTDGATGIAQLKAGCLRYGKPCRRSGATGPPHSRARGSAGIIHPSRFPESTPD